MKYNIFIFLLCALYSCKEPVQNKSQPHKDPVPDTISVKDQANGAMQGFTIVNMNEVEFETTLAQATNRVLIDVRSDEEYKEGFIAGAINIDVDGDLFDTYIKTLDKNKVYFVYCAGGSRSRVACNKLKSAGFTNLFNLDNGIEGWKDVGKPIVYP